MKSRNKFPEEGYCMLENSGLIIDFIEASSKFNILILSSTNRPSKIVKKSVLNAYTHTVVGTGTVVGDLP